MELHLDVAGVATALNRLSPALREAVLLAYAEPTARTQVQIAELLDLPLGTAKSRIRDGLIKLRTILAT